MKTYYSNINDINNDVESFVIAKSKIENQLIKEQEIEKKMSISDFLNYINLGNCVYVANTDGNDVIPFKIYKFTENETILVYASNKDKIFDEMNEILSNINFNIDNLTHISTEDFLNGKLQNRSYFIINNEFYAY